MLKDKMTNYIIFSIIVTAIVFGYGYMIINDRPIQKEKIIMTRYVCVTRNNVNELIECFFADKQTEKVLSVYDSQTHSREVTLAILTNALNNHIPINIFFAKAKIESGYNQLAEHKNETKTTDYGLMQLNSLTYRQYNKEYLLDINNNCRLAASYISSLYEKYGLWEKAICHYNSGKTDRIPESTLDHLAKVLDAERKLNDLIASLVQ